MVAVDALPLYRKYTDLFEIDSVPETELKEVAGQVAARVVAAFPDAGGAAVSEGVARRDVTAPQP
jgi:hypothetical protein